jgi:DNA-binding response OmpR family regulator
VPVLDIMLPEMSGYEVCRRLRDAANWTPILMLTAKTGEYDQAEALDTGADDYLTKPFSYVVLLARIRGLLWRAGRAELSSSTRRATSSSTPHVTAACWETPRCL